MADVTPLRTVEDRLRGARRSGFVGRQLELARATALLRGGPGGTLVVRGPAGIGKSAFCREVQSLAEEHGYTVARVDAVDADRPYAVVTTAIERLLLGDRDVAEAAGLPVRSVLAMLTPLAAPVARSLMQNAGLYSSCN